MIYTFGGYEVETQNYELRRDHQLIKLEPRGFDVLIYLIEHRDQVVMRDELIENLWPDQYVGTATLNVCISAIRRALGDDAHSQKIIKTTYGRGYRFVAEVSQSHEYPQLSDTPLFSEPVESSNESDLSHAPLIESSQDVLGVGYGLVTILCCALDPLEAEGHLEGVGEVYRLQQQFVAAAYDEVKQNGSYLRHFGTDAVLMVFGLPNPCNQHASRAIQSALRLQRVFQGTDVSVRGGIHTGPIELDRLLDEKWLLSDGQSEVTSLAIGLYYWTKSGELLTTQATIACVEDIDYIEYGTVCISRQPTPILAYRICGG